MQPRATDVENMYHVADDMFVSPLMRRTANHFPLFFQLRRTPAGKDRASSDRAPPMVYCLVPLAPKSGYFLEWAALAN